MPNAARHWRKSGRMIAARQGWPNWRPLSKRQNIGAKSANSPILGMLIWQRRLTKRSSLHHKPMFLTKSILDASMSAPGKPRRPQPLSQKVWLLIQTQGTSLPYSSSKGTFSRFKAICRQPEKNIKMALPSRAPSPRRTRQIQASSAICPSAMTGSEMSPARRETSQTLAPIMRIPSPSPAPSPRRTRQTQNSSAICPSAITGLATSPARRETSQTLAPIMKIASPSAAPSPRLTRQTQASSAICP